MSSTEDNIKIVRRAMEAFNTGNISNISGFISPVPIEIAKHFNFTLPAVSTHLRILKDADLITEEKQGKNRLYSLNRKRTLELVALLEQIYDKEKRKRKKNDN